MGVSTYGSELMQNAAVATGDGQELKVDGFASACIELSGTFVATVTWEVNHSPTGGTWFGVNVTPLATGTKAATATTTGLYSIPCLGARRVRARISAYTSGNVTAKGTPTEHTVFP